MLAADRHGIASRTALFTSIRPSPKWTSKPGSPRSTAESSISASIWAGDAVGTRAFRSAASPEVAAAPKLVPVLVHVGSPARHGACGAPPKSVTREQVNHTGTAEVPPGPATSIELP